MKRQLAVEFIIEYLDSFNKDFSVAFLKEIKQAIEIEKKNIKDAYQEGKRDGLNNNYNPYYYNEENF